MAARNKRRRDKSGYLDPYTPKLKRYESVLRVLGLWEAFSRMPRGAQTGFCQQKFPDPVLEFEPGFPDDADHRRLRKTLDAAFREASIEAHRGDVTIRDYFAVLGGLKYTVQGTIDRTDLPIECMEFMREAQPILDYCYEQWLEDVWLALHAAIVAPLLGKSRIDGRIYFVDLKRELAAAGKDIIRVIIRSAESQMKRVRLDGAERPVYRVGTGNEWHRVQWLSWGQERWKALCLPGMQTECPVYVQSHALRRLSERINLSGTAPYLEHWLFQSLKEPRIIERQGADLLVEYRIKEHRLGYLVVTPLKDQGGLLVVRTFKFLTMEHTPEARLLKKRLRLQRPDVEWLGLDDLTAFTKTDLRNDPLLRVMLSECGCGHLFELSMWSDQDFSPQSKPFAAEMRRYLKLAA